MKEQKYSTEGQSLIAKDYFQKFKETISRISVTVNERVSKYKTTTTTTLKKDMLSELDYKGEPEQLYYSLGLSARDFKCDWNFLNREVEVSNNLAMVKNRHRKAQSTVIMHNPKYEHYQFMPKPENATYVEGPPNLDNLMFVIKVYLPFEKKCRNHQIKIMQEIHVVGHQSLKDLLNAIKCNVDYCGLEDVSEQIGKEAIGGITQKRKENFPASYIYINKTFYRSKRHIDTTSEIRQWLVENYSESTEVANLEVSLQDIELQTGRPYLFQHQGDCEHVVIISDIRFTSNTEFLSKRAYPHVAVISGMYARHCMLCGHSSARWLIKSFLKLTLRRAFLCHRCLLSYCYVDGRKAGDFQVYQYVDPVAIL